MSIRIRERRAGPRRSAAQSLTDRQERIEGWRQDRIAAGRALLVGAGALGNEVAKNLALMGLGYMFVVDFDRVEHSNLSRAVLFRRSDARKGRPKAELVARRAQAMNVAELPVARSFQGDVVWELGAGVFRRVDVVIGCLDNIEARMAINLQCFNTGAPLIDGGILGLAGSVIAVRPPETACWECSTGENERNHAADRYHSCSNVMLRELQSGRLPSVQVASTIIAGFQTQEAVKIIQGKPWAAGSMIMYDASGARPDLDVVRLSRRPSCWCQQAPPPEAICELPLAAARNTLAELLAALRTAGVADPHVYLPSGFGVMMHCAVCGHERSIMRPSFRLDTSIHACDACPTKGLSVHLRAVTTSDPAETAQLSDGAAVYQQMLRLTLAELGFASLALVRYTDGPPQQRIGRLAELTADAEDVMGGLAFTDVRQR